MAPDSQCTLECCSPKCCGAATDICCGAGVGCIEQKQFMDMGTFTPTNEFQTKYNYSNNSNIFISNYSNDPNIDVLPATLYRSLNAIEITTNPCDPGAYGILARYTRANEWVDLGQHIGCPGYPDGRGDWFVSFTTNFQIALEQYGGSEGRVAVVQTNQIHPACRIYDLTVAANRERYLVNIIGQPYARAQNLAARDFEVVIWCPWFTVQIFTSKAIPCTYYQQTELTDLETEEDNKEDNKYDNTWIYIFISVSIGIILLVCGILYFFYWKNQKGNNDNHDNVQMEPQMVEAKTDDEDLSLIQKNLKNQ